MTDTAPTSPLSSALSIEDIFSLPPSTISDADLTRLVSELRRRRSEFLAAEAAKAMAAKKPKSKIDPSVKASATAAKLDKPSGELSLDDLI